MNRLSSLALGLFFLASVCLPGQPLNQRVLIVHNTAQADSLQVAQYYQAKRSIPAPNLCGVSFSHTELIPETEWLNTVRPAIRACLNSVGRTNILYIVLSFKTPFTVYRGANNMALDSYVADIWDGYSATNFPSFPPASHRYYQEPQTGGNYYLDFLTFAAYRAQPRSVLFYSAFRLDGPSQAQVQAMIDNAFNIETGGGLGTTGTVYVDRQADNAFLDGGANDLGIWSGDFDLRRAAEAATAAGLTVVEDQVYPEMGKPGATVMSAPNAGLYCGWYAIYDYQDIFTWKPGSVAWHLDSGSAVNPRSGPSWSAQALLRGVTVTSGAVAEPYLQGMAHPDVAFRHLLAGGTVGDAFLRSNPWLKWRVINIGDPLYRPFPGGRAPFNGVFTEDSVRLNPPDILSATPAQIIITLKNPAPVGGQVVNLFSTWAPFYVPILPATVTVPAGQRTLIYDWPAGNPVPNDVLGVAVRASYGAVSNTATLRLYPYLGQVAAPAAVVGGASTTFYVVLNAPAPLGGLTVSLASDSAVISVPASVTVPAGSRLFAVTVTPSVVGSPQVVNITATQGVRSTATPINVTP